MKVIAFYLAFLLFVISFLPYAVLLSGDNSPDGEVSYKIKMYNHLTQKINDINLEDYIVGVVSAEMSAVFSAEALKTQAVAARTYALYKAQKNISDHNGAQVCTDFSHCQAFVSDNEAKEKWGEKYNEYHEKIKSAVYSTASEVLTYDDNLAMTVFHSCSNGVTEKASDVWSADVPYLVNTKSEGDSIKNDYVTTNTFTKSEFVSALEKFLNTSVDTALPLISDIVLTDGGNVSSAHIYGNLIKGTDIRKIFSLKSTAFEVNEGDDNIVFTVTGYGHGVGMSQYGAEAMARDKYTYDRILSHYYPQTVLTKLNKNDLE